MTITEVYINGVKNNPKTNENYIDIYWESSEGSEFGLEFGHIYLYSSTDGKIIIDSEYMDKSFIEQVFKKLVNVAELKY
jgi:hypothetical protein